MPSNPVTQGLTRKDILKSAGRLRVEPAMTRLETIDRRLLRAQR